MQSRKSGDTWLTPARQGAEVPSFAPAVAIPNIAGIVPPLEAPGAEENVNAGLYALALAVAAPPAPTGLQAGDAFTFTGNVVEEVRRPPNFFRRAHSLELRVLVLNREEKWADVAVLTRLERQQDAVSGAVGVVTGHEADKNSLPLVRLELVRVHTDGTVHVLMPNGPPPLRLNANTPARALPPLPLETFAPAEFGLFPPRPPREEAKPWTVADSGERPDQTWQATRTDFLNAERCQLLVMNQMSPNWAKPVGGQTAWHRADAVWVSTLDGTARKVHRVIRQRDGIAETPAAWVEVQYQLKHLGRLGGTTFERAKRDAEVAYTALADAARLAPEIARLGAKTIETHLTRIDAHLQQTDAASPYREAMLAARRVFDDARQGNVVAPVLPLALPAAQPPLGAKPHKWPEPGHTAPDITTGVFRLSAHRGKPVVLVFLKPGGDTGRLALAIADALQRRYAGQLLVVPLVVFDDVDKAKTDRDKLKLTIPLHDGTNAVATYGVETTPRFALIDAAGKVRWTFTGVGAETGFLLKEEADKLVPPVSPVGASRKIPAPVTAQTPIRPPQ